WYVLVSGQQMGPLEATHVAKMLRNREVDKRTYAWRDGMGDWVRLGAIDEFAELAAKSGGPAPRATAANETGDGNRAAARPAAPEAPSPLDDASKRRPTITTA